MYITGDNSSQCINFTLLTLSGIDIYYFVGDSTFLALPLHYCTSTIFTYLLYCFLSFMYYWSNCLEVWYSWVYAGFICRLIPKCRIVQSRIVVRIPIITYILLYNQYFILYLYHNITDYSYHWISLF